jgi:hypothetical protein
MPDFNNLIEVRELLKKAQDADHDNRERDRDVTHFLEKDDGQWEPDVIQRMLGRPRYTFDKCNPIVDAIAGEIEQADFDIRVRPAGGDATKELAKLYDGIIRNIENMSNAQNTVYGPAARQMVASGFDAWRVVQEFADSDSFDQDLLIVKIGNAVDRVWFDIGSEKQDRSDSKWAFVLQSVTRDEFERRWPEANTGGVGDGRTSQVYEHKPDTITVGEFLYLKDEKRELVQMSNGAVYEVNDDFDKVKDELAAQGITEEKRRERKRAVCFSRLFNDSEWLTGEQRTVFSMIPVVPVYANFKISENKVIYRGAINKLMDAQRVYNYAQSRAIEEGALAPRNKFWMTREQASGNQKQLQTLNTNADPVQFYKHVDGQALPFSMGGAQINPGLQQTAADMAGNITESSGIFAANQGDAPNQSGVAIELQQNKGDTSTIKYFKAQEVAICCTAKILVDAIPRVYDTKRQMRVLNEDGSFDMKAINEEVFDNETQTFVTLNDLSKGQYDVTCDVGPAFKNRQQETIRAITEIAAIDPSIIQTGADVLLNNIQSPGVDVLAERVRSQMVQGGLIPPEQWTEEEQEQMMQLMLQQQQQAAEQGPDPVQQAILEQTQAQTADVISKAQERQDKALLEAQKIQLQEQKMVIDAQQSAEKQELEEAKVALQQQNQAMQMLMQQQNDIINQLQTQAQTLKTLREAQGVDVIVGPHTQSAYIQQAELVNEAQDGISPTPETQRVTDRITGQ